jgi:hypothetical protein
VAQLGAGSALQKEANFLAILSSPPHKKNAVSSAIKKKSAWRRRQGTKEPSSQPSENPDRSPPTNQPTQASV